MNSESGVRVGGRAKIALGLALTLVMVGCGSRGKSPVAASDPLQKYRKQIAALKGKPGLWVQLRLGGKNYNGWRDVSIKDPRRVEEFRSTLQRDVQGVEMGALEPSDRFDFYVGTDYVLGQSVFVQDLDQSWGPGFAKMWKEMRKGAGVVPEFR